MKREKKKEMDLIEGETISLKFYSNDWHRNGFFSSFDEIFDDQTMMTSRF